MPLPVMTCSALTGSSCRRGHGSSAAAAAGDHPAAAAGPGRPGTSRRVRRPRSRIEVSPTPLAHEPAGAPAAAGAVVADLDAQAVAAGQRSQTSILVAPECRAALVIASVMMR